MAIIKFKTDIQLNILHGFNEENECVDEDVEAFRENDEVFVTIMETHEETVDLQFFDGSFSYGVPKKYLDIQLEIQDE